MARDEDQIVTQMVIRGTEYNVRLRVYGREASEKTSKFVLDGVTTGKYQHEVMADTLQALYAAGMAATKAQNVKIAIPIMQIDWTRTQYGDRGQGKRRIWRSGKIVGRHAGNGNVLVQWDGETKAEQDTGYSRYGETVENGYFRPLTPTLQDEFLSLLKQRDIVHDKIETFRKQYVIDPVDEIEQEKERVASEQEAGR